MLQTAMADTEERRSYMNFTKSHVEVPNVALVKKRA